MRYIIRLKDSLPQIGIFEYIDEQVLADSEEVDLSKAVNGIVDAGHLFHIDLIKAYKEDPSLTPETREIIKKNINNPDLHRYFPRGRICYNMNDDVYEIYSTEEVLKNIPLMNAILREFHIPVRKLKTYVDNAHYKLLDINELK